MQLLRYFPARRPQFDNRENPMNYKEITQIKDLKRGDIVRHRSRNGTSYVVNAVYGERATAITTADMTNPDEWEVMKPETANQSLDSIQQELAEIREDNSRAVRVKEQPEESARQAVAAVSYTHLTLPTTPYV